MRPGQHRDAEDVPGRKGSGSKPGGPSCTPDPLLKNEQCIGKSLKSSKSSSQETCFVCFFNSGFPKLRWLHNHLPCPCRIPVITGEPVTAEHTLGNSTPSLPPKFAVHLAFIDLSLSCFLGLISQTNLR